jgi:hypothetical protein
LCLDALHIHVAEATSIEKHLVALHIVHWRQGIRARVVIRPEGCEKSSGAFAIMTKQEGLVVQARPMLEPAIPNMAEQFRDVGFTLKL